MVWCGGRPAGRLGSAVPVRRQPSQSDSMCQGARDPTCSHHRRCTVCVLLGHAGRLRWRPADLTSDTHASFPDGAEEPSGLHGTCIFLPACLRAGTQSHGVYGACVQRSFREIVQLSFAPCTCWQRCAGLMSVWIDLYCMDFHIHWQFCSLICASRMWEMQAGSVFPLH